MLIRVCTTGGKWLYNKYLHLHIFTFSKCSMPSVKIDRFVIISKLTLLISLYVACENSGSNIESIVVFTRNLNVVDGD